MEEVHNPVETELAKKEKSTSMDEFLDKFSIVLDQQNPESAADLMNTFKKVMEEKEKENDELRVNNQFLAQTLQFKENALNNINQGVNAIQADPEDLEKAVEHVKKGALEYRKGIEHFYNVTLADVITKSHNSEYESGQKKYGQPDWETRQNNLKEWQNIAEILPPSVNKIDLEEHIELASKLPTLQNKLNTLKFMRDEHLKGYDKDVQVEIDKALNKGKALENDVLPGQDNKKEPVFSITYNNGKKVVSFSDGTSAVSNPSIAENLKSEMKQLDKDQLQKSRDEQTESSYHVMKARTGLMDLKKQVIDHKATQELVRNYIKSGGDITKAITLTNKENKEMSTAMLNKLTRLQENARKMRSAKSFSMQFVPGSGDKLFDINFQTRTKEKPVKDKNELFQTFILEQMQEMGVSPKGKIEINAFWKEMASLGFGAEKPASMVALDENLMNIDREIAIIEKVSEGKGRLEDLESSRFPDTNSMITVRKMLNTLHNRNIAWVSAKTEDEKFIKILEYGEAKYKEEPTKELRESIDYIRDFGRKIGVEEKELYTMAIIKATPEKDRLNYSNSIAIEAELMVKGNGYTPSTIAIADSMMEQIRAHASTIRLQLTPIVEKSITARQEQNFEKSFAFAGADMGRDKRPYGKKPGEDIQDIRIAPQGPGINKGNSIN